LKSLTAAVAGPTPELPQGDHLVSVYNFGPDGATFILNIKAIFRYDVNALPEGTDERNLHVIWWNGSDWKDLGGKINTNDHIVSVSMEHFCLVALAAGISPTGTTAEIGSSDKPSTEPAQMAVNTTTMPITPTEAVPQPKSIFQTVSWGIIILIFAAALAMGYVLYRQIRSNINHHKQ
jgi:hypothetical protein